MNLYHTIFTANIEKYQKTCYNKFKKGGGDLEKQTKNIITRDLIEKELRFDNTADIRSTLVACGALSLLFVPLTIGFVYGFLVLFKPGWLKILFSVLIGTLTSAPVWIHLLSLKKSLTERKLLQNGDFDIVVCEVQYKDEKLVYRHTEKVLHFNGFKEIMVGNVPYDFVSQGDEFCLVHYKGQTTIKLLYSLKMYDYRER